MWQSRIVPGSAPDGTPILSVLGKQTYRFEPDGVAQVDDSHRIDVLEVDSFLGDGNPINDPVRHESDLVAWKPMTDIVVHGKACSPRGKCARHFDARIAVGDRSLAIRVFGDRKVDMTSGSIRFSEPEVFEEMPLHSGFAYGGTDLWSDPQTRLTYPRNPSGKGFAVAPPIETLHRMALPNLENPSMLLTPEQFLAKRYDRWKDMPQPAYLGWTQKLAHPRFLFAGMSPNDAAQAEAKRQRHLDTMPEIGAGPNTQPPERVPVLNPQYFNGAHPSMQLPYLRGDDKICLVYMDRDTPNFQFQLPGKTPKAVLDLGKGAETMDMVLHTVEIYKPTNQLTMVWRGSCRYGGPASLQSIASLFFDVFNPN